jgi:hypothetical protein
MRAESEVWEHFLATGIHLLRDSDVEDGSGDEEPEDELAAATLEVLPQNHGLAVANGNLHHARRRRVATEMLLNLDAVMI